MNPAALVLLHLHARRPNGVLLSAIQEALRDFASPAETAGLVSWLEVAGLLRTSSSAVSDREISAVYLTPRGHRVLAGESWPGLVLPPRRETGRPTDPIIFFMIVNELPERGPSQVRSPTPTPTAPVAPAKAKPKAPKPATTPATIPAASAPVRVDAGAGIIAELRWSNGWVEIIRRNPQGHQVGQASRGPWVARSVKAAPAWIREIVQSAVSTGKCPPFLAASSGITTSPR